MSEVGLKSNNSHDFWLNSCSSCVFSQPLYPRKKRILLFFIFSFFILSIITLKFPFQKSESLIKILPEILENQTIHSCNFKKFIECLVQVVNPAWDNLIRFPLRPHFFMKNEVRFIELFGSNLAKLVTD